MDIATIAGIIVFLGFVVVSIVHAQGFTALKLFVNMEAFLVVLGGTFCALLVNYPLSQVLGVRKVLRKVL
ncbi:MAG: motility protein A, partial [Elusimicrobiota bacterium]|nr:motility protein A [Elusimicrobiota bacterium]